MKLQTKVPIKKEIYAPINYQSKLALFGSCFSENIGEKLKYYKFQSFQNPFGISFHPKAIENSITKSINDYSYTESDVFLANERWHSFDAHSSVSTSSKEELITALNTGLQTTKTQLQEATHIIITLGTAWVYRFIETDKIVANCHKLSQKKFLKELLSVDEIIGSLQAIITLIQMTNKHVSILFTVSPVRHLKDGFVQNQISKSQLIAAIHELVDPRKKLHYFPSYELMMDELRDYRFYCEDMVHPNTTAINYIWERFSEAWVDDQSHSTMQQICSIQKGIQHKPFNTNSLEHQKFLQNLNNKIESLQKKYPFFEF